MQHGIEMFFHIPLQQTNFNSKNVHEETFNIGTEQVALSFTDKGFGIVKELGSKPVYVSSMGTCTRIAFGTPSGLEDIYFKIRVVDLETRRLSSRVVAPC